MLLRRLQSAILAAVMVTTPAISPALASVPLRDAAPMSASRTASVVLVKTPRDFESAMRAARPGDTIALADGEWRDFQMVVDGSGRPDALITVTAQTPGKVFLTGQSNLRMAGRYLVVSNLVFKDGYSPTGEVISFRRNRENRATDSRVTGMVIDSFSKPERRESDNWVAMYGQKNRFDHSHLVGKTNAGTTLVVVRDEQQGLENHHRIDHNYFGPRPNLGSNGGETLRVGTSHDAESNSYTVVEYNWFDNCDGEVEIISNKSGGNIYRGNVFFESRGALTLRHGDGNLVEDNVFIGNGKPHTGGIRIINRNQTVRNNYMVGLAGEGFASALTVMYGVPNSPANRYVQVEGATIQNNTIVNARSVFLGAGMDAERSAAPVDSILEGNLIVNTDGHDPIRIRGDISGLRLEGNIQSLDGDMQAIQGVTQRSVVMVRGSAGLSVPEDLDGVGARPDLRVVHRQDTGVSWYPKNAAAVALDSGAMISVHPGEDTLTSAFAAGAAGDQLVLKPGEYQVSAVLRVDRPMTVRAEIPGTVTLVFDRPTLFEIVRGGSLKLVGLTVSGQSAPDSAGNAVVRATGNAANYQLLVEDTLFTTLTVNRAFDVIYADKGTTADLVSLTGVTVRSVSGSVLSANTETDDLGFYNVERLEVEGSVFEDIRGAAFDVYRGGTDESTFGPNVRVEGSVFRRVGNNASPVAALDLHGVQRAVITNNQFIEGGSFRFYRTVGAPSFFASGNSFDRAPEAWSNLYAAEGDR